MEEVIMEFITLVFVSLAFSKGGVDKGASEVQLIKINVVSQQHGAV